MAFRDECGVFGVWQEPEASRRTYLGLYALQHRGQEAAGICSMADGRLVLHKGLGHVADVFSESTLDQLPGDSAIGHTRYSTTGGNVASAAHPFLVEGRFGQIALCHNGNLTNTEELRSQLIRAGQVFSSPSDSEVILALINRAAADNLEDAVLEALAQVRGAYSILLIAPGRFIAVRDPHGFRPLALGRLGQGMAFSSETCAFDLLEVEYLREVQPGEVLILDAKGMRSRFPQPAVRSTPCVFEHVYFSRPDSLVYGQSVTLTRREMGRRLALRHPVPADLVVPVPDSGVSAALGYAEQSGIPFEFGLVRNHYVGRTFIEPRQSIRSFGVKVKLNPVRELLLGKRVVLVDDSLVRGTTSRKIVQMVRGAGDTKVHTRLHNPPTTHPCFYGIDTPSQDHLLAARIGLEEIREFIGADTIGYLAMEDLQAAMRDRDGQGFCYACFTGDYPVPPPGSRR